MTRINVEVPEELHRRAAACASLAGVTLTAWVNRVVEEATDRELAEQAEAERRRRSR